MVNGERILRKFDHLNIDPMATIINAMNFVDTAELDSIQRALDECEPGTEGHQRLQQDFVNALRRWKMRCAQYANENPVHFEPRFNEVVFP